MRAPIIVIGLLIAHLASAQQKAPTGSAATVDASEAVQMAPVETQDLGFSLGFSINRITGKISAVKFTRVDTWCAAARAGLRADDSLIAIDGIAVVGTKFSDFAALLNRSFPVGGSTQYSFTVARGSKKNRVTTIVTFSVKGKQSKKEPNQALEPTAPSGRGSP